jgi:hypothetical protein
VKFGLKGHKEDARTLKLADFVRRDFNFPVSCDLTLTTGADTDDLGNLDVGNCALAGPAHRARWEARINHRPETIQTSHVVDEYQQFGYVPGVESTDNGCYAIDVMRRARNVGLFGGRWQIDAFAWVDFRDRDMVAKARFLLDGLFLCLSLPQKVKDGDLFYCNTWDVASDDGGKAGNHLVWMFGEEVNSWGRAILLTPAFIERYGFDCYAVVGRGAVRADGRASSGLDLDGMMEAVRAVTG